MADNKIKSESNGEIIGNKSVAVIIVAAGRGHRASKDLPKQYQTLFNKSLINPKILENKIPKLFVKIALNMGFFMCIL